MEIADGQERFEEIITITQTSMEFYDYDRPVMIELPEVHPPVIIGVPGYKVPGEGRWKLFADSPTDCMGSDRCSWTSREQGARRDSWAGKLPRDL